MEILLLLPVLISLFLTIAFLPKWIKKCKEIGLVWEDMNKYGHPKNVAASGGIIVIMAFIIGVLSYIAVRTFVLNDSDGIALRILSLLAVVLILAMVSLTDDFLGWKKGGLSWRFRVVLAFVASIPLVVINAGVHTMDLPFFGVVNLQWAYAIILIPLGIAATTTVYNFLAGFNGLESGMGIIILSFLSFIAYVTGTAWLSVIGLIMVVSLIAFYVYNKFPAKVFPGNTLTWAVGSLIAGMAILGNFEKVAAFVFIPYVIEMILKIRGRIKKQSFGIPDKNNNLKLPFEKIYGLTHFSIWFLSKFKKEVKERDVVYFLFSIEIIFCLLALILFRSNIFN
jgi:UDP-N-acetylglucosamine--dolichyl-phosphate N-acetylglucosaminephosphotransferase